MARQNHTPTAAKGNYPALPIAANALDVAMTAAIAADKEQFTASGKDSIFFHNTGAAPHTVTFTSVANPKDNRTGDVTADSIGAGEYGHFGPLEREGWVQSGGKIYFEADHAEVKFGVVSHPQ